MSAEPSDADRATPTSLESGPVEEHPTLADLPNDPEAPSAPEVAPFEHIVDDLEPKEAAADWAHEEMLRGRTAEEIIADLQAGGWTAEDADWIVEFVRKATRHERGVTTREDVARQTYASYRESTRRLPYLAFSMVFGGLVTIFISAGNLMRSIRGMRKLKAAPATELPAPVEPLPLAGPPTSPPPAPPYAVSPDVSAADDEGEAASLNGEGAPTGAGSDQVSP